MTGSRNVPASRVLVIAGPTASGKTPVSLELARRLNGEVISADSRQVYKYLDIGTAKPSREERGTIPHHFLDILLPDQDFNAGEFGVQGRATIKGIFQRGRVPIVVGGSGLYIQSLIDGLFEGPGADPEYRAALECRLRLHGISSLLEELKRVDPFTASTIDVSKPRRVIRALEVFHLSGIPISEHHRVSQVRIDFEHRQFGMLWERRDLYERIEQRCEKMVAEGLLDEVDGLEKRGYGAHVHALASVGYAEAFAYRRGEVSYAEMMRLFKQNSRRYAKRQMTWFRRGSRITWLHMHPARTIDSVCDEIAERFLGN